MYKIRKVPIVKAKIGPQVMDLLCDEEIFDKLTGAYYAVGLP